MSQGTPVTDLPNRAASAPMLSVDGGVATLTLNRPAHRNRLEAGDLRSLLAQFERINADPAIRVLVLTANTQGQPRPVFCAGYHLGSFGDEGSDPQLFEHVANALAALRPITVCALNGSVYGGATDLMLACDLSVGLTGTEFRMPATALGLHYYPGGLQRYVARLGLSGAKRAFLTARPFTAEMLQRMGCFEALVGPDDFDATVRQLVGEVAALAPLAVQATKQSINEIAAGQPDLAAMRAREVLTSASEDFAEGRQAFQDKRQPRFTGR
ncbi:MAG: enoyl-CoA hydratase-related protein [Hydrogenophaga sp.]|nr:enoyl-CoA hydratase-related protein [Hydrogenophaga sp.]